MLLALFCTDPLLDGLLLIDLTADDPSSLAVYGQSTRVLARIGQIIAIVFTLLLGLVTSFRLNDAFHKWEKAGEIIFVLHRELRTALSRLCAFLPSNDPAVLDTPFGANIDIKDTVNYHEVMKQYQLGPNGGILAALILMLFLLLLLFSFLFNNIRLVDDFLVHSLIFHYFIS
mgnify:CR=1 FL=1